MSLRTKVSASQKTKRELRWMLLYVLVGITGVAFDFLVFFALVEFGIGPFVANAVGYLLGTALSFITNSRFVFRIRQFQIKRLGVFFLIAIASAIGSSIALTGLLHICSQDLVILKFAAMAPFLTAQYVLNRVITFGDAPEK